MPRASRADAERHRATIEDVASRLFRERGFGVSVADLMAAAGMTHGGFYGHFESKDALVDTACRHAFDGAIDRWQQRVAGKAPGAEQVAALVDGYLSLRNRDEPGAGCPLIGLGADVARESDDKRVRQTYAEGLRGLLDVLIAAQGGDWPEQARQDALVQLSALVGAVALARAVRGDPLGDELIEAVRARLLTPYDAAPLPHSTQVAPAARS